MAKREKRRMIAEINVVPYIDVMLVLLVIFMITAPLLTQGVAVELPKADAAPITLDNDQAPDPLIASIDKDGALYLNIGENADEAISQQVMLVRAAAVLRVKPNTPVMVKGDGRVPYAYIVNAMVILQKAGAPKVGLITDPGDDVKALPSGGES
jgi:biopolymer transport protein TolR